MGVNCCSHEREEKEIVTIIKPEKNIKTNSKILNEDKNQAKVNNLEIINTNQNDKHKSIESKQNSNENQKEVIYPIADSQVIDISQNNKVINVNEPLDLNTLLTTDTSNKSPLYFSQNEKDNIFNNAIKDSGFSENQINNVNLDNISYSLNNIYNSQNQPLIGVNFDDLQKSQNNQVQVEQFNNIINNYSSYEQVPSGNIDINNLTFDNYFNEQNQNQNQIQTSNINVNYDDLFQQQNNNNINNNINLDLNTLYSQNQVQNLNQNYVQQTYLPNEYTNNNTQNYQNIQNDLIFTQQNPPQTVLHQSINVNQFRQYSPANSPSRNIIFENLSPNNPLYTSQQLTNINKL